MRREFCSVMLLACLSSAGALAAEDDAENGQDEPTSFASRIMTITDVVLQNHIDPPTRQQMILAGIKALYRADNRLAPKGLSGRVSKLARQDQFADYLAGVRAEFDELQDVEAILTRGMLTALAGASFLIDAKTNKVQEQVVNNRYVGTGIALTMNGKEKLTQITNVFYNGPAWKAGVKSHDLILEINGESTDSKDMNHVVQALRGEAGSEVALVVRQPDSQESRMLTVTRGRVFIPSVEGFRKESAGQWQFTVDSAKDIAILRLRSIGPSTLHELRQVAAKLRQQDVRGIVLDLRGGGGILHDIIMVADSLLDGGTIGHVRSWEASIKHEARPGDLFQDLPMAVLVAQHTSAGNVFLTAALQDNQRAFVVGEPTTGETYVGSIVPIPGRNDQLRLAIAVMLRGDGTPLLPTRFPTLPLVTVKAPESAKKMKRPGFIVPDHVVHFVPRKYRSTIEEHEPSDPMLAKAIEVLRNTTAQASSRSQNDKISG